MTRWVRAWGPALLWAAAIFALSSRSTVPGPEIPGLDKAAHFGAYGLLGVLLARGALAWPLALPWALALSWAYGAADEVHQMFVPGRSPDWRDWVADALGAAAGIYLYRRWHARRRRARGPLAGGAVP